MRISSLLIVVCAVAGIIFGASRVGHAVDAPARQLQTVIGEPAQAAGATAQSNLAAAVSAAASYKVDHGTYAGMTTDGLRGYDQALASGVSVRHTSASSYCVESKADGATVSVVGPNGFFVAHGCA